LVADGAHQQAFVGLVERNGRPGEAALEDSGAGRQVQAAARLAAGVTGVAVRLEEGPNLRLEEGGLLRLGKREGRVCTVLRRLPGGADPHGGEQRGQAQGGSGERRNSALQWVVLQSSIRRTGKAVTGAAAGGFYSGSS